MVSFETRASTYESGALTRSAQSGHALVHFDPKEEARIRLKIDLYIVPTVAILYLFCFIDVSLHSLI